MTYLYGDSTDSGLELNYIELLREFLDVAVQILLSEHRIATARKQADEAKRTGDQDKAELEALREAVKGLLEQKRQASSATSVQQSAIALERATDDTIKRALGTVDAKVSDARHQHMTRRDKEHKGNTRILSPLLLHHELPDSDNRVSLKLNAEGNSYDATVLGSCRQGLAWRMRADIPSDSSYRSAIKVGSLAPELTIRAPEKSGFVRKSIKLKPLRLSNYLLRSLEEKRNEIHIELRTTHTGDEAGLDLVVSPSAPRIKLVRITKGERSPSFEPEPDDERVLLSLCEDLARDARALIEQRCAVLDISYGGTPLNQCDKPAELVRRLVDRLGPVIQAISSHSLDSNELVLKRVLADDRREEIFASKAELRDKLSSLPGPLRQVFAPLGLGDSDAMADDAPTHQLDLSSDDEPTGQLSLDDLELSASERAQTEIEITADMPIEEEDAAPTAVRGELEDEATKVPNAAAFRSGSIESSAARPKRASRPLPPLPAPPTLASKERAPTLDSIDEALESLEKQG